MKPTPSKDGELRFTINVPVRASRDDLINAMCHFVVQKYGTDLCGKENVAMAIESCLRGLRTRKAFFCAVKEAVLDAGEDYWVWSEGISDRIGNELREQVRVLVVKKFPELNSVGCGNQNKP